MAMLNLDFSNVPSREPLPEGIYDVSIAKVEDTTSKNNNPMLKIEFDVLTPGYEKRKLWSYYVLTADAMWKMKELCDAVGLSTDEVVTMDTAEFVGLTCKASVGQRVYEGNVTNEIKKLL